jgi:hypothetical protein
VCPKSAQIVVIDFYNMLNGQYRNSGTHFLKALETWDFVGPFFLLILPSPIRHGFLTD